MTALLAAASCAAADAGIQAMYENVQKNTGAVQAVYRGGVPHTDRQGRRMMKYDPETSFFPIAIWGQPAPGETYGTDYRYEDLQEAHFNTVWPYGNVAPLNAETLERLGEKYNMQIVFAEEITEENLEAMKNHPRLLGNVWMDEPIGQLNEPGFAELFERFLAYKAKVNAIAPDMVVFVNDAAWIEDPATEWFVKWNTAGDVACHDNYPVQVSNVNTPSITPAPQGTAQSMNLTVAANREAKPAWLIVGAFEQSYGVRAQFPFRFPTPAQLRAQVYTGLIYGATGIVYFIQDSFISRNGSVVGMSPDPKIHVVDDPALRGPGKLEVVPMTPTQQAMSKALWETSRQLNYEMTELTPALLSPTVAPDELGYSVAVDIVKGSSESGSPIRTLLKPDPVNGGYILLTANVDAAAAEVTFTFDRQLTGLRALFDSHAYGLQLSEDGKSFTMNFDPHDAVPVAFGTVQ